MDRQTMEEFVNMGYKNSKIAEKMGISVRSVKNMRREFHLRKKDLSSTISDASLDESILSIVTRNPEYGEKMISGNLNFEGVHATRARIRESMHRVDPEGIERRKTKTIHRREYRARAPNSMWHIDGHHKLIRWRMVTHGGIDGYSRLPVYLKCSSDNRATTVVISFLEAIRKYGLPEKVRADKGGENVLVADVMLQHPRRGVGTFLTGRSVHNQRIERLWRDVFTGCISTYYRLFYKLEDLNVLDNESDHDIFALHYVFLPLINQHLESFRQSFMRHKIRTAGNQTPLQLWHSEHIDVELLDEGDLPENIRQNQNDVAHVDRVYVPGGMEFTDEQLRTLSREFPCSSEELKTEDDKVTYYTALREYLGTI